MTNKTIDPISRIKTNPTNAASMTIEDIERFASKIVDEGDCWGWSGVVSSDGYPEYAGRKHLLAHRIVAALVYGEMVPGMVVDHLCSNPICCKPYHLDPTTQANNVYRGRSFAATYHKQTHCLRGHEFNAENTYSRPGTNWRECRVCKQRGTA